MGTSSLVGVMGPSRHDDARTDAMKKRFTGRATLILTFVVLVIAGLATGIMLSVTASGQARYVKPSNLASPPPTGASPATSSLPVSSGSALALPSASTARLITNPNTGQSGIIEGSADGGTSWQRLFTAPGPLTALDFVDAEDGWAVGSHSFFRTTDGGRSWQALSEPGSSPVAKVDFVSSTQGWAVTKQNGLLVSSDGGLTWVAQATPLAAEDVCFSSPANGWVVGASLVDATSNGGQTWKEVYSSGLGAGPFASSLSCQGNTAWAEFVVGAGLSQQSVLLAKTDGGPSGSWSATGRSGPQPANGPQIPGQDLGFAGSIGPAEIADSSQLYVFGFCSVQCPDNHAVPGAFGAVTSNAGKSFRTFSLNEADTAITVPFASFTSGRSGMVAIPARSSSGEFVMDIMTTSDSGTTWTSKRSVPMS